MSDLTFRHYQEQSKKTAVYPRVDLLLNAPDLDADALWTKFEALDDDNDLADWARTNVPALLDVLDCRRDGSWVYPVLGLGDEVGEVLGKYKKLIRDQNGIMTPELREAIVKEQGDPIWYQARLAESIEQPLGEVAQVNLDKLFDRKARGVLKGSGDDR